METNLYNDTFFIIFSHLNLKDICHLIETSKFFKSLIENKNYSINHNFILTNPINICMNALHLNIPSPIQISDFWLEKFKTVSIKNIPTRKFMEDDVFIYFFVKIIDKDIDKIEYMLKFYFTGTISFDRFQSIYNTPKLRIFNENYFEASFMSKGNILEKKKKNKFLYESYLNKINKYFSELDELVEKSKNASYYEIRKKNLINYGLGRHLVTSFLVFIIILGCEDILPKIFELCKTKKIKLHKFCLTKDGHLITDLAFNKKFFNSEDSELNLVELVDYLKILEKYGYNEIKNLETY